MAVLICVGVFVFLKLSGVVIFHAPESLVAGFAFFLFNFPLSTVMMSDISVMPACASQISLAS